MRDKNNANIVFGVDKLKLRMLFVVVVVVVLLEMKLRNFDEICLEICIYFSKSLSTNINEMRHKLLTSHFACETIRINDQMSIECGNPYK